MPQWAALGLLAKKGKGYSLEPFYKGKEAHLSLSAGGNDMAQLKIPSMGVVATSEKHTLTHSRHRSICFLAATWGQLTSGPQSDSEEDEVEPPFSGVTLGSTYPMDDLLDLTTNETS